jgi:hypothetical protein
MFREFSRLFRAEDRPKPEGFWNGLDINARREILEEEGFDQAHIRSICSKNWKHLSEVERIWLFSPLLLASMEVRHESVHLVDKLSHTNINSLHGAGIK